MSEKIKGIIGSKTRAKEVLKWLIEQGAEPDSVELLGGDTCNTIYYVNKRKQATWVNAIHSELFNIVELPRWRAETKRGIYYFIDSTGHADLSYEEFDEVDDERYEFGNYFKTKEEAELYAKKVHEIFKKKLNNNYD